ANVVLGADEGGGHSGLSNPLEVLLQNDLSISITDSPDPVAVGAKLTYALTIANVGPSTATAVTVTNVLPPGVTFVSANTSQGSCTQSAGVVTCNLGTVPGSTNATVTIVVVPTIGGVLLTNIATVARGEADPYAANNSVTAVTLATLPTISIADASVAEHDVGTTNIVFAVTLAAPSSQTISVNYYTSDG